MKKGRRVGGLALDGRGAPPFEGARFIPSLRICALTNSSRVAQNELFAIGRNTEGQLGMGKVEQQPEPKAVDTAGWIPRCGHLSVGGFSGAHSIPSTLQILSTPAKKPLSTCAKDVLLIVWCCGLCVCAAHNFFVPVPRMEQRRVHVSLLMREQRVALAMALHARIGAQTTTAVLPCRCC